MDTTWNDLGKAFWDGGIFGVAKTLMSQRQAQPPQPQARRLAEEGISETHYKTMSDHLGPS